ncbi:MAG: HdeA/HdeB family chaperone [Alphaproteobacteria bacterium]
MRRGLLAAAILALSACAASAEKIDLSTMTCAKFQASSKDEIGIILTWLDAYYRDDDDPPVIDTDRFIENAKKLGEYCAGNPTIGLITATDKLFSK